VVVERGQFGEMCCSVGSICTYAPFSCGTVRLEAGSWVKGGRLREMCGGEELRYRKLKNPRIIGGFRPNLYVVFSIIQPLPPFFLGFAPKGGGRIGDDGRWIAVPSRFPWLLINVLAVV